ncbi:MAG: hypothetical protein CL530_04905 [Aequorivita sp.]|nr:hypothetical protein [Aequorivita sp.]
MRNKKQKPLLLKSDFTFLTLKIENNLIRIDFETKLIANYYLILNSVLSKKNFKKKAAPHRGFLFVTTENFNCEYL